MSKLKEFVKKLASKFSTPVKPLAADVFEEKSQSDTKRDLKMKLDIKIDDSVFKESINNLQNEVKKLTMSLDRIKNTYYEIEQKQKIDRLKKIQNKTRSSRIKKKLQKRIDTYVIHEIDVSENVVALVWFDKEEEDWILEDITIAEFVHNAEFI